MVRPTEGNLTGTTTTSQSRLESNGNEGALPIPLSSKTKTLPSDNLVSYPRPFVSGGLNPLQSAFSTAPADLYT